MGRLVVASNRLPVVLKRREEGSGWSVEPAAGGLVTAMEPVMRRRGGVWVGWSGTAEVGQAELDRACGSPRRDCAYELQAVKLPADLHHRFYEGFSNQILWPVFHGFPPDGGLNPLDWDSYREVNRRFAGRIAEAVRPGDRIWIHDYHLMLVANELRALGVENPVSFFLHTPFPRFSQLRRIPGHGEIVRSLLEHDLIGFQMLRDESNFLEAATAVDPHRAGRAIPPTGSMPRGRHGPRTGSFPISIDYREFADAAASADVTARAERLRQELGELHLVLGVDRLDYTKGLTEKIRSFDLALRRFPEMRGRMILRQLVIPSRGRIASYARKKTEIEELARAVNEEWSRPGWRPIDYRYGSWSRTELLAHYRIADVALVTPLNDGMNLVAKEYCAANEGTGVLILSVAAGAAAQLGGTALLVNPSDALGVAHAISNACTMPIPERRARMTVARQSVRTRDVHRWVGDFLEAGGVAASSLRGGLALPSGAATSHREE